MFKADLHNKYCVKKARWEEHMRVLQEEEEMITDLYRQYKVTNIKKIGTRVRLDYVTILNRILKLYFKFNSKQFVLVI